jgi:DNA damage-binding protein 1
MFLFSSWNHVERPMACYCRHRAPRNTRGRSDADEGAFGILDGDFLEQFLALMENSPDVAGNIATAGGLDRNVVQAALETLQSMH